jgi:hypothetical protein
MQASSMLIPEQWCNPKLGAAERSINAGDGLSSNEQVTTAIESATQVRFIDDTTLTVGPSSSVVLERFVVNPNRTTGRGHRDGDRNNAVCRRSFGSEKLYD